MSKFVEVEVMFLSEGLVNVVLSDESLLKYVQNHPTKFRIASRNQDPKVKELLSSVPGLFMGETALTWCRWDVESQSIWRTHCSNMGHHWTIERLTEMYTSWQQSDVRKIIRFGQYVVNSFPEMYDSTLFYMPNDRDAYAYIIANYCKG